MPNERPKPVLLMILDGYGIAPDSEGNAITKAKTPVLDRLFVSYPSMPLRASGDEVGLSWGEMGNSEVGHLTVGAGRVLYQTLPRINKAIEDKSFFGQAAFLEAVNHAKKNKSVLHILGIISPGRVHGTDAHVYALLELAKQKKVKRAAVQVILDGRDTVYNSGIDFVTALAQKIKALKIGAIATLSGRYFAMDRDNRWDRIEKAYRAMAAGESVESFEDPLEAIKASYAKDIFDERFTPTVLTRKGEPVAAVGAGDAVIFANFRPDRARQLTHAFVSDDFKGFARDKIKNLFFVTMTEYEEGLPVRVAFPKESITMPLARVLAEAGLKQLHIAETEKYAHVTHFFNGTREEPLENEDRVIVPSPPVAAYDTVPEMSAYEITKRVIKAVDSDKYDFMVMNFANPDMVAHTGKLEPSIRAIEAMDECVGKVVEAVLDKGGVVVVTADHGNAEELLNLQTGAIDKEHSTNPVPLIVVGKQFEGQSGPTGEIPNNDLSLVPPVGVLADVAPTILKIMNLPQPPEMTGQPLI